MPTITSRLSEKCPLALSTAYCHLNSSDDTETKVRSVQSSNQGLNPQWMQEPFLHNARTGSRVDPASHPTVTGGPYHDRNRPWREAARIRMRGAILPLLGLQYY